ncbi:MAG: tRNA (adenosine(37)-N6)-threonylcarbamoyltransferase complex ATPase subunit type 1 TsaE [Legionellales bacterium]|nr:tRNA (adenosine(37)-N6)-threonylcarbamoyltransferase complex ATPase subunit type 1 TsaE [Legionellales bacterium]
MKFSLQVNSPEQMSAVAGLLAVPGIERVLIFLHGDLGAGKTTFVRGLLAGFRYKGNVPSPTYTLVESYSLKNNTLHHFDLYRIHDPEELYFIGIDDYIARGWSCVEWPEKAEGALGQPDLEIRFEIQGDIRKLHFESHTEIGRDLLQLL